MFTTLFAVALLHCNLNGVCTPHVMEDEVYLSQEDCDNRVAQLQADNPGRTFQCGTVLRRAP